MSSSNTTGGRHLTALDIIRRDGLEGKLVGKVIVMTGATAGIGLETARALALTGATLFLTARDRKKAETNLASVLESGRATLVDMDNASLSSVRAAAATILAQSNKVNILIGNAGVQGFENLTLTEDGYEMHFEINYLSHVLLFQLLKPSLLASSTPDFHSRVVLVSSNTHHTATLNASDNYNFEKGGYSFMAAYAHSKLAEIYLANELERRYGQQGLHGLSVHPGIVQTDITRNFDPEFVKQFVTQEKFAKVEKSSSEGAATTVVAAIGKDWEGKGGKYLENCEEARRGNDNADIWEDGWGRQTYDPESEARLWNDSLKFVKISED